MAKYYYDRLKTLILPRNADVNMIIGARGLGKTYGVRKYMIEDYLKNGYCFVEVTRFREENNDVAANYFSRIVQDDIFPDYEFRTTNKIAEIRRKKTGKKENEWKTIGYFIPLSLQQQKKKSTYVNVRNICMDEIIIDNDDRYHTYLKMSSSNWRNLWIPLRANVLTIRNCASRGYFCSVMLAMLSIRISNIMMCRWNPNLACNGWAGKHVCSTMCGMTRTPSRKQRILCQVACWRTTMT